MEVATVPKINVYLPEDLAAAVRTAKIPVSAVCQRALADAVRKVGQARRVVETLRDPHFSPDRLPALGDQAGKLLTERLRTVLALGRDAAAGGTLETRHILLGLVDEGQNLGLRVLQVLDVDVDDLRAAAAVAGPAEEAPSYDAAPDSMWAGLAVPSRRVVAASLEAALELGHNYVGCEHLLMGLTAETAGHAAGLLADRGVDAAAAARAVAAMTAGYARAREDAGVTPGLQEILQRLERIETRLATTSPTPE
jgi:ClpA/ClpB-like protein/post-segregation antitoxin CcdA